MVPQNIAIATDGVDELAAPVALNLVSEQFDVDVYGVEFNIVVEAPNRLNDGIARRHPSGAPHQMLQDAKLSGRQRDARTGTLDVVRGGIQREVINLQ